MNVKRYYRAYEQLIKKHERLSYQIVLKAFKGIYTRASDQYLAKPDMPIELMVNEADTLNILVKIYDSIGIAAAKLVQSSLPKQKHSSLNLITKAGKKPPVKQYQETPDDSSGTHENYWKQEFLRFTQSPDCTKKVKGITETTRSQIRTVITNGVKDQYSHKQIAALLLQHADEITTKKRALLIARTENAVGSNLGAMAGARASGLVLYKLWIARSGDSRTRDAHAGMIDKAPIPIDDLFLVGNEKMLMPGDSSNGATAKNICNCRCTVAFIPASEVIPSGLNPKPAKKPRVVKPKPDKLPDLFTEIVVDKPTNQYIPLNTVEDCQKWAIDNGMAKHVDYSWCKDVKVANEMNRVLFDLKDRFSFDTLNQIGGKPKRTTALMSANFQTLNIQHSYWKSSKIISNNFKKYNTGDFVAKSLENARICKINYEKSGRYSWLKQAKTFEDQAKYKRWTVEYGEAQYLQNTIHHEFGHILHDQLIGGCGGFRVVSEARQMTVGYRHLAQELNDELYLLYGRAKQTGDIYKISAYSNTNEKEFFAEAFTMHLAKDPELPIYMTEYFDKLFRVTKLP